jgi:hypothetical protein
LIGVLFLCCALNIQQYELLAHHAEYAAAQVLA